MAATRFPDKRRPAMARWADRAAVDSAAGRAAPEAGQYLSSAAVAVVEGQEALAAGRKG